MSEKLPDIVKATRARYVARFPVPQGEPGDAFEEQARQWSRKLSQQVHFDTGNALWGMKNAGGGRPTSKDTIAFRIGVDTIRIWDLLTGTGTGHPRLVPDPSSEDVAGQVFESQPAVNHVGGIVVPDPHEPPPPPPPVNGTDLVPYLDEVEGLQRATVLALGQMQASLDTITGWI